MTTGVDNSNSSRRPPAPLVLNNHLALASAPPTPNGGVVRANIRAMVQKWWRLSEGGASAAAIAIALVVREEQQYVDSADGASHRRKTMVSTGDRSAKIRTYNYPQGRMTDHRINLTIYNLPSILDGNIQEVLGKLQMAENAERLKESNI